MGFYTLHFTHFTTLQEVIGPRTLKTTPRVLMKETLLWAPFPETNKFATVTYSEPERLCFMRTIKGTVPVKARKEASKHFFLLSKKMAKLSMLGHFRVALSLRFKARLNECEAIAMKTTFYSRANKTHFHLKDFPLSFVLKQRDLELENDLLFIAVSHPEP